jgi:hypothetical protein
MRKRYPNACDRCNHGKHGTCTGRRIIPQGGYGPCECKACYGTVKPDTNKGIAPSSTLGAFFAKKL